MRGPRVVIVVEEEHFSYERRLRTTGMPRGCAAKKAVDRGDEMHSLVVTDDQDSLGGIRLGVGEDLEVTVAENATTGFEWGARTDPSQVLEIVDSRFEAPGSRAAGAAGRRRVVVAARRAGNAVLTMELRRPWETQQPPGRRVSVSIAVQAASGQ